MKTNIDLSKPYSGLLGYEAGDDVEAGITDMLCDAEQTMGTEVRLGFIYLPLDMTDKNDPHNRYWYIGWVYIPQYAAGGYIPQKPPLGCDPEIHREVLIKCVSGWIQTINVETP